MNKKVAVFVMALALMVSLAVIIVEIPIPVRAGTIYVDDDYGSEDNTPINPTKKLESKG